MVQPLTAGALAQHARRRQKEKNKMVTPNKSVHAIHMAKPTKVTSKEGPSRSVGKATKTREDLELEILEKAYMKGGDVDKVLEREIDILILKNEQIETSPSEEEDDEEEESSYYEGMTPEQIEEVRKRRDLMLRMKAVTDVNMMNKYKPDQADYDLQYATKMEQPMFFETYTPKAYPCFYSMKIEDGEIEASKANSLLLEYASEVMSRVIPETVQHLPPYLTNSNAFRKTGPHTNICVNPLQAMRAWALLSNVARSKTKKELLMFLEKYTSGSSTSTTKLDEQLLGLHAAAEEEFDGCVRLFTELPRHLNCNKEIFRNCNICFGGKSKRAAVQHHCFATDSDGLYSCYRINEEIALSTRGAIRYVIPENRAPNWRASLVLASAMDCTFYWKTSNTPVEAEDFLFQCSKYGPSKCTGIYATASIRIKGNYYRLESFMKGVSLFIVIEDPNEIDAKKSISSGILKKIYDSEKWPFMNDQKVFIPKCTTSIPISLNNHAKSNGLSRIYCSEKSELRELKSSKYDGEGSPQFVTLFDHYHKTNFEICARKPDRKGTMRKFDVFSPTRAHQCIDESMAPLFGKFQQEIPQQDCSNQLFTYFEDHLHQNKAAFAPTEKVSKKTGDFIDLGKPFYYILTRTVQGIPFIVCAGYFNNTIWVNEE